jgi:hypothetical protein
MWQAWVRREMDTEFWWENLEGRYHYEDLDVDAKIILKWILREEDGEKYNELMWLRIVTNGGVFRAL